MFDMSLADQKPFIDHDAEVAQQKQIEDDLVETTARVGKAPRDAAEAEAVANAPTVTIRSIDVDAYPLSIHAAGLGEDGLIFNSADETKDVLLPIAEQLMYSPNVEVVE